MTDLIRKKTDELLYELKQKNIDSSIKVVSQEELGRRKSGNLVF